DDGEEVLPPRRVADGEIALLDARSAGGRMRTEPSWVDLVREEPSGRAANEEPVLEHRGFLTGPGYARRIGRKLLLACALLAVAGCGGSSSSRGGTPPPRPPTGTPPPTTGRPTRPPADARATPALAPRTAKPTSPPPPRPHRP